MTIKVRKNAAWDALSLFIRKSYADREGFVECYTCGRRKHYKEMDAGHGISGRKNAVLFMEKVVKPQDTYCNKYLGGNYKVFTPKLIEELGADRYQELAIEAMQVKKMYPEQYLEVQRYYEAKLAELEG